MKRYVIFLLIVSCFLTACSQEKVQKPLEYRAEVFNGKWMTGEYIDQAEKFLLAGEQGSIAWSRDGNTWHYSDTPTIHTLHDLAFSSEENVLMAVGENAGILRSRDGGESWQAATLNIAADIELSDTRLNTVVYLPKQKAWLAAGTQNAILRSQDQGQTWNLVSFNTSDEQLEILTLFVEQKSGDALFAGQYGTTGRSTDGGLKWEIHKHDMDPAGKYIPHVVDFYQNENVLIATADHGRLLISKDNGKSWDLIKTGSAGYFTDAAYDPERNIIALTTQMGEVALSYDAGTTWALQTFEVANWPSDDIPLLAQIDYDAKSQSFLVVGNSGVVARSHDGGATWFADIYRPLFNMSITTLLHHPQNGTRVSAGLGGVIAKTGALGVPESPLDGWSLVRPGIDQYIREVVNLSDTNTFVAVGQLGGIWRSDDDGRTWEVIEVDYPFENQPPHLRDIVEDPQSGALIAAGPVGTILRSTDQGKTWESVFQGKIHLGEAFTRILYNEKNETWLASEVLYRSIYRSQDVGKTWEKIATIDSGDRNLWHGVISDKLGVTMLVGQKGGIAISRDLGENWEMPLADTTVFFNDLFGAFADDEEGVLLAVGKNGMILRSEDGSEWKSVESGTASTLRRVVKDPKTAALIAFGQQGTVIRSTDAGLTWSTVETPVYEGELRRAVIQDKTDNLLIVGRDGAILRSVDGGLSWHFIASHTKHHFRSAEVNPKTGTVVVVGEGLVRLSAEENAN